MNKIITTPTTIIKIKKGFVTGGTIVVEPNVEYPNYEVSLKTIKTLFGEQASISRDFLMNRECLVINDANFLILNSESIGADVEFEVKVNDPLPL